jgi:hypothetical protein
MNLGEALQFLREYDREASGMCFRVTSSQWNYSTNITETNKRRMVSFISKSTVLLQPLMYDISSDFIWFTSLFLCKVLLL